MKKIVCIYIQDRTTVFLEPLCTHICDSIGAVRVGYDTSGDEDPLEVIFNEIRNAEIVFFLGHGMSSCLYASIFDNVELFNKENVSLLSGKRLFLIACNSNQFIDKYALRNSVGFGFLPTSDDDIRNRLHNVDLSNNGLSDINYYNEALVNSLIASLSKETIEDLWLFRERFRFCINRAIVNCLIEKEVPHYRVVADELFYVYADMIIRSEI